MKAKECVSYPVPWLLVMETKGTSIRHPLGHRHLRGFKSLALRAGS